MRAGSGPRSSGERCASYRSSALAPGVLRMRGATSPTRGSSKWGSSSSSQPSGSATSESTNATSGVVTCCEAGHPGARRADVGVQPDRRTGDGRRRRVVDDDRPGGDVAAARRGPGRRSSRRTAVKRCGPSASGTGWMAPASSSRSTRTDGSTASPRSIRSTTATPPVGEPEQLQRRPADHDVAVTLDGPVEPVPHHASHSSTTRARSSASRREQLGSVLGRRGPWIAQHAARAQRPHAGPHEVGRRRDRARLGTLEPDEVGADREHQRRLGVPGMRIAAGDTWPPGEDPPALGLELADGAIDRDDVAAVTVDQHDGPCPVGRPDQLDDDLVHRLVADRQRAGEPLVLAARRDRHRRRDDAVGPPGGEILPPAPRR